MYSLFFAVSTIYLLILHISFLSSMFIVGMYFSDVEYFKGKSINIPVFVILFTILVDYFIYLVSKTKDYLETVDIGVGVMLLSLVGVPLMIAKFVYLLEEN